ncbi:hypothetical protein [Rubrivirga marina]|uniref:CYTH domain-containing protein n=1 Tax=Rubrivirga marina TaxID=1196024 RepID=A0A271IXW4_9BACT|nr:hypothetical protein [Rubrivirga marina]PAP75644.1 hypothetical protein BSZ37_03935 [Rubrivirga marina]
MPPSSSPIPPLRTTEARWFLRGETPAEVAAWFDALGPPVEGSSRTDRYLAPTSDALGVKLREGQIEAKRLDGPAGTLDAGRASAPLETWTKWSFALAEDSVPEDGWVEVRKTRRQREHEAGGGTCRLELSEVTVDGDVWWSVCLEAEGPSAGARQRALATAAARWLGRPDAPALPAEAAMGYPAWLRAVG